MQQKVTDPQFALPSHSQISDTIAASHSVDPRLYMRSHLQNAAIVPTYISRISFVRWRGMIRCREVYQSGVWRGDGDQEIWRIVLALQIEGL